MMQPSELTFMTRVEQMFSKITSKNPFLEYSWLLESSPWRAREYERTKESNQLAMLSQHRFAGLIRCWSLGKMGWKLQVVGHFVSYYCYTFAWEETNLETSLTTPPHRFFRGWHVNHRNHISYLQKQITVKFGNQSCIFTKLIHKTSSTLDDTILFLCSYGAYWRINVYYIPTYAQISGVNLY